MSNFFGREKSFGCNFNMPRELQGTHAGSCSKSSLRSTADFSFSQIACLRVRGTNRQVEALTKLLFRDALALYLLLMMGTSLAS